MGTDKRERQKAAREARLEQARAAQARAARTRRLTIGGAVVVVALAVLVVGVVLSGDDETDVQSGSPDEQAAQDDAAAGFGTGPCPPEEGVDEAVLEFADSPQRCIDDAATYVATFDTSEGPVRVILDTIGTPVTANNFVTLARYGYYDDTLIHRTEPSIGIIQGGAPKTNDTADPGPGYTIPDEAEGYTYRPGQLVMARTNAPNSAGGQFFFTVTPAAANLDGQGTYVVFGEVIEGLEVLSAILGSDAGGAPGREVVVRSVTIEQLPPGEFPALPEPPDDGAVPMIVESEGSGAAP